VAEQLISDPGAINAAVKALTEEVSVVEVTTEAPSDTEVKLPGGFINREDALVKTVEVRELNGADEETVARAGSTGRALAAMLQRGLVSLGGEPTQKEDLDTLLAGDRDTILIGIRKATFGKDIEYTVTCPFCSTQQGVTVDLNKDIPMKTLDDPIADRTWTYDSKHGPVLVSLPNGLTQRKLLENSEKTAAEMNTILLAGCVLSVNGSPSMGASTVLKLGWKDREAIVEQILDRNPGPRLGEVKKGCESCGEEFPMPLTLASMFRI
jgi:hypothetical protein